MFSLRNSTELQLELFPEPVVVLSATDVHLHPYVSLKLKIKLMKQLFKRSFTTLTYMKAEKLAVYPELVV